MTSSSKLINVYCDESCYLQLDGCGVMALGALYCPAENVKQISEKIRQLKLKFGLNKIFEIKWTKVSSSKSDFYQAIVDYFFSEPILRYRCVLIPEKSKLDHERFKQTHDEFYYKMYYTLLVHIINPVNSYNFYLDLKDTQGGKKNRKLQEYLSNKICDYNKECVTKVQQIRSHESEVLQICDLFTGAITYENRHLKNNMGKIEVVQKIKEFVPSNNINHSSRYHDHKFNLLVWDAR
jgi:hypothetical protein